ncbi:uncharacterized protein LOC125241878 isoform X2 [Leguminivora glycinivorella]|uniref:uncharacterized protein LOC125241878 isoform X2 n=1 Tax=Leguminivora glycinivorella TaxID=1035111 RepID=UPI00200EE0D3|nr:uncharacterized protein LOC125241878 isoform X2 [Leguminivora glycinivorella]
MIFVLIIIGFYLIVLSQERLLYDVTAADQAGLINSDDDELTQALLLIDILKTDYLKLLRQESQVANTTIATTTIEQSTSKATTVLENQTSASSLKQTIPNLFTTTPIVPQEYNRNPMPNKGETAWQPPRAHAAPLFPLHWPALGTTWADNSLQYTMPLYVAPHPSQAPGPVGPPLRPWRRFMPDYFFYDVPPRRFPKSQTNRRLNSPATLDTVATTKVTVTQKMSTTKTTKNPTKSTKNIERTHATAPSRATTKSLRTSHRTGQQRTSKKTTFHKKTSTYIKHTNIIEAEVASELLKEFKLINITPKTIIRKKLTTVDSTSTE